MEELLQFQATWWKLLLLSILLTGIFFALRFANRAIAQISFSESIFGPVREFIRKSILLYEPVSIFLLSFIFVFIEPVEHGALMALLFIGLFPHVRNYLTGRLVLLEKHLSVGDILTVGDMKGELILLGRLGLKVRTQEGVHHLSYRDLTQNGYRKGSGMDEADFYRLEIHKMEETAITEELAREVRHILAASPYTGWDFHPRVILPPRGGMNMHAEVRLHNPDHLRELNRLLSEHGFEGQEITRQTPLR